MNSCQGDAPSTFAASYRWGSMLLRPARKMIVMKGKPHQTFIATKVPMAMAGLDQKLMALSISPSPIRM